MRMQPVCSGVDSNGELVWATQQMAEWQMRMFPIQYKGDFGVFWMKRALFESTGIELEMDSMTLHVDQRWNKKLASFKGD